MGLGFLEAEGQRALQVRLRGLGSQIKGYLGALELSQEPPSRVYGFGV